MEPASIKKYILPIIVLILAACSPREDRDVKSTSQDIKQKSTSASVSEKIKISASNKPSVPKFYTHKGCPEHALLKDQLPTMDQILYFYI